MVSAEDPLWGALEGRFQIDRLIEVPPISKAGNAQVKDKDDRPPSIVSGIFR